MISSGNNIISAEDKLVKISIEYLYNSIKNPSSKLETLIKQLRLISEIDKTKYNSLKRQLPYIVCAHFNPPYRKTDNFSYTQYFVVDIDHINEKGLDIKKVKNDICKDDRVLLCFNSPSEDGLKVIFMLNNKCFDHGLYSVFYKMFVYDFSKTYNLEQVIDKRTFDVCRACFLSSDSDIYYNPISSTINLESYVSIDSFNENNKKIKEIDIFNDTHDADVQNEKNELTDDIYSKIKEKLYPNLKITKKEKNIFTPKEIESVTEVIRENLLNYSIDIVDVSNINYGKKYKLCYLNKKAEVNIFYGKKGFTVVQSPKTGTDKELNSLVADIISSAIL